MQTAEEILEGTIASINHLRKNVSGPVHALIWGAWGTGKTYTAQKVASEHENVFYIKVPDGDITKGRLYRMIGYAIGSGARHTYEATLDMMIAYCEVLNIKPILILDEAQRILRKPTMLNELKDLSEIPALNFSYIFLGDKTVPKVISAYPHSIHKRIFIKRELDLINERIIEELLKEFKVKADPAMLLEVAKKRNWTTIDVVFVLQVAKKMNSALNEDMVTKIAQTLGR